MKFIILMQEDDGRIDAFGQTDGGDVLELADLVARGGCVDVPLLDHPIWEQRTALVDPPRAMDPALAYHLLTVMGMLKKAGAQAELDRQAEFERLTGPDLSPAPA